MKKRIVTLILSMVFPFSACLVGCNNGVDKNKTISQIPYFDGITEDGSYDTERFYRNDLTMSGADPHVIWVSEEQGGKDGGYFYMYITGAKYTILRSRDLVQWEKIGSALAYEPGDWFVENTAWAPDVRYNPEDGKYYLYMTSMATAYMTEMGYKPGSTFSSMHLSVAIADSPCGPFVPYEGTNANGEVITRAKPAFDFRMKRGEINPTFDEGAIDAHFYVDGEDKYLYFSSSDESTGNCIYGVKMKDWVTPDYSTFRRLVKPGQVFVDKKTPIFNEGVRSKIHEGPWMLKRGGRYYLGYSNSSYTDRMYQVNIAVSDSPLGPFEKITEQNDGISLGIMQYHDHMGGTGHNTFLEYGGEVWNIYHAHRNRASGAGNPRAIAMDKVEWINNETLGYEMPYTNGPTYSIQPLPSFVSGYRNLAKESTVTVVSGKAEGVEYLNDGIFTTRESNAYREAVSDGKVTYKITLPEEKTVCAVMVYNSFDCELAFSAVDEITLMTSVKPEGFMGKFKGSVTVKNLRFDESAHFSADSIMMRPGGAAIYEFKDMPVTEITVTVSKKILNENDKIGVSDIVVLGK